VIAGTQGPAEIPNSSKPKGRTDRKQLDNGFYQSKSRTKDNGERECTVRAQACESRLIS